METTYRDISRNLNLPNRAVKDSKTILTCYDRLVKNDINKKCVDKVLAEKSISHATKVISSLNYCLDNDKLLYLDGKISASELHNRRKSNIVINGDQSLDKRAKRLKDDSDIPLTFAMIKGMFKNETYAYLESICTYTDMVEQVSDNKYDITETIKEIILARNAIDKAITSLKEAIINKSNITMEENYEYQKQNER